MISTAVIPRFTETKCELDEIQKDDVGVEGVVWQPVDLDPYRTAPKNHDVRVRAATDANTAPVYAELQGVLAKIIDYP